MSAFAIMSHLYDQRSIVSAGLLAVGYGIPKFCWLVAFYLKSGKYGPIRYMTLNMRRKTIISTIIKTAINITNFLLQHSPSPNQGSLRLDRLSGAMLECVFMTVFDSV